jgi:hypothetical protein
VSWGSENSFWPGFSAFADKTSKKTGDPYNHDAFMPSSYSLIASGEHPGSTHSNLPYLTSKKDQLQVFFVPARLLALRIHASLQAFGVFD